jgi:LEA14-like dessication related protein
MTQQVDSVAVSYEPRLRPLTSHYRLLFLLIPLLIFLSSCRGPKELSFVRVADWKATETGLSTSWVSANLVCSNPNPYRLTLQALDARVLLDGRFLGTLRIDQPFPIPPSSEFTLPIRLQVNMSAFYASGLAILLGNEVQVTVDGTAKGSRWKVSRTMPVQYNGKHRISDFKL